MSILDRIEIKTEQYPWKPETITAIGTLGCGTETDFSVGTSEFEIKHVIRRELSGFIYGEIHGAIRNVMYLLHESIDGLSTDDNHIERAMLQSAFVELQNARKLCR